MEHTGIFIDILVVLLAAKVAGELAERAALPAVCGEILAGLIIGPSAFGLVESSDTLQVLGELGVILLLFTVGLETELTELLAVGRASMSVALAGVILPFAGGIAIGMAIGFETKEAVFVGAALTATSVGITARVFGDLRALATTEARTVLGAAVADDVIGLVILTVVVGVATQGSVSVGYVSGTIFVAIAFLVVTSYVGMKATPFLFGFVSRHSRSAGTLVAVALAFTLATAELADAAKLAPIVGAFVAGIALRQSHTSERVRRELTPVGHLFIPVFFLQIGIEADIDQFRSSTVLRDASLLIVVGIVGKLLSALVLRKGDGDRWLIGAGMVPRGEVGLIFATIGLREGVFGDDVYAALLLTVLVTTVITPPVLRLRMGQLRKRLTSGPEVDVRDAAAWLHVQHGAKVPTIELAGEPPFSASLPIALEAARLAQQHRPGATLLDWFGRLPDEPMTWNTVSRAKLHDLLDTGGPRSWRLLYVTGVLERAVPELAEGLRRRQADLRDLDPIGAFEWPTLARVSRAEGRDQLVHPENLALAAIIFDATDGEGSLPIAQQVADRLNLGPRAQQSIAGLIADIALLPAAARRIDQLREDNVRQMAAHIGSAEQARALYMLGQATNEFEPWELARLDELHQLVQDTIASELHEGVEDVSMADTRRLQAARLTNEDFVRDRILAAPRAYVLAAAPEDLLRQAKLLEPPLDRRRVRVAVTKAEGTNTWRVDFGARDRLGLVARETAVLAHFGYNVIDALAVTWGDGLAIASFRVTGEHAPDFQALQNTLEARLDDDLTVVAVADTTVVFDDHASPWHTLCSVEGPDRAGLLSAITTAFAATGASVKTARVTTDGDNAVDVFELTDPRGAKLSAATQLSIEQLLRRGAPLKRGRRRDGKSKDSVQPLLTGSTLSGDKAETPSS
ncbi:MAG: cation:proton antiporter [Acidimicrobiales bacterium]